MAADVDDARRVLAVLGVERVVVVGWSLGGFIAANVAAVGDAVDGLVLVDGGSGWRCPRASTRCRCSTSSSRP